MIPFKSFLKSNKFARKINSDIKGLILDYKNCINAWKYNDHSSKLTAIESDEIALKLLRERIRKIPNFNINLEPHIFFVGTCADHEKQGFLQGLQNLGLVTSYINANGDYGINKPRDVVFSAVDNERWNNHLYDSVVDTHRRHRIDFIIGTFTEPSVSLGVLQGIRKLGIPIVNYAMDDMLPEHWRVVRGKRSGAYGLGSAVDLTLQTTKTMVQRYIRSGYPCIYFPLASDPKIFKRGEIEDIDVLFIGNCYGKREALISKCLRSGINVKAYGLDFPLGYVSGEDVPQLCGRAKIILGSGLVGHSSKINTLKLRDFDAPMSGALYLTSYNPSLLELYNENVEILTYRNHEECIKKIKYYLSNDRERVAIAKNGRAKAVANHTWDKRFELLISMFKSC